MGIRNLARELHLSIGTVSRALNDRPDVNPETRARVKAAAARAGYVPDQSGRSLRSGRTGMVAVAIPTIGQAQNADSGLFKVLEGARRTLRRESLDLIVLFRGPDEDPLEHLQSIAQRRIADAFIVTQTVARDPRIAFLSSAGVGFVTYGRSAGHDDVVSVDTDFEAVARETVRRFLADGHRRLALAIGETPMNYQDILGESLRAEVRRQGPKGASVEVLTIRNGRLTDPGRAMFAAGAGAAPTAILAAHESIAAGLYVELGEMGRRVGEDLAMICTFPVLDAAALSPALSYFDADLDATGVALGERLCALLSDDGGDAQPLAPALIPVRLEARASHNWRAVAATA